LRKKNMVKAGQILKGRRRGRKKWGFWIPQRRGGGARSLILKATGNSEGAEEER